MGWFAVAHALRPAAWALLRKCVSRRAGKLLSRQESRDSAPGRSAVTQRSGLCGELPPHDAAYAVLPGALGVARRTTPGEGGRMPCVMRIDSSINHGRGRCIPLHGRTGTSRTASCCAARAVRRCGGVTRQCDAASPPECPAPAGVRPGSCGGGAAGPCAAASPPGRRFGRKGLRRKRVLLAAKAATLVTSFPCRHGRPPVATEKGGSAT